MHICVISNKDPFPPNAEKHLSSCFVFFCLGSSAVTKRSTGNTVKLPPIANETTKLDNFEKRIKNQAMTYLLWKTPPMQSIYIRWPKSRLNPEFSSSSAFLSPFKQYGPFERVVKCTENSAIVVFTLIRSACHAATHYSKQVVPRMFVVWLPEYLGISM